MKKQDVIRAWRDGEFYAELSNEQKATLPQSPAAVIKVEDEALGSLTGGCSFSQWCPTSAYCSPCNPYHCY